MLYIVGLASLIVLGLAVYAGYLLLKVRKIEAQQAEKAAAEAKKKSEQQAYIVESLQVISANVIEEDLNLSEATIRCKMLLDALFLNEEQRKPYQVLDSVFEQIKGFDTHKARKALSKDELRRQDKQRETIENENRTALLGCFALLRHFSIY